VWVGVDQYKRDIDHSLARCLSIYAILPLETAKKKAFPAYLAAHGPYQEELETV
jgi:hypothetical protein